MTGVPPAPLLPDLISCVPDPPTRGNPVEICFDFREGDPSPIVLTVEFSTPAGLKSQTITVSHEDPCESVDVPSDATGMTVKDPTGTSDTFGRVISS